MPQPQPQTATTPSAQVTAAEISRIAGVTRATVSNWRRRHADFPAPSGGTESSPLYDLATVQGWLRERGHTGTASPAEELRTALRLLGAGADVTRYFPLLAAARRSAVEAPEALDGLSDAELAQLASRTASVPTLGVPFDSVHYGPADAGVIRALLSCVRDVGTRAALDVLAERELEESAASGTYQTPSGLADFMAAVLPVGGAGRVLDPACGSGTLLVAAAQRGARALYGQDALALQVQRAGVAVLLAEPPLPLDETEIRLAVGDSLRADAFPDVAVDAVLCNPPFGDRDWGHDELAYDPRWAYGVPPRFESELAWVQHALAHVEPGGYVVMLLPPALAFRTSGRRIRTELLRSGALRAVVALPARVAYPLHVALQVWILQRPEPGGAERASVLFVDGAEGGDGGSAGFDWSAFAARVLPLWTAFREEPEGFTDQSGVARAVGVVDLLDDVVDVSPARHVRATAADVDPAALARQVGDLYGQLRGRAEELVAAGAAADWQPVEGSTRERRNATVADLARGGALTVLRAAASSGRDSKGGSGGGDGRVVLTARDVSSGGVPSGAASDAHPDAAQTIEVGDVLVRAVVGAGGRGGAMTRVAEEADAGALLGAHLHLLRPDPARVDPWFLAGFIGAADNIAAASSGSTMVSVNPGRLRVPLMPLAEQRRYGVAFRRAFELRALARRTAALAEEAAGAVTTGLTAGALLPPAAGVD